MSHVVTVIGEWGSLYIGVEQVGEVKKRKVHLCHSHGVRS
jgi:hypothetical protein